MDCKFLFSEFNKFEFYCWLVVFLISIEWTRWFFSVFFLFKNIFKYLL